MIRVQCPYCERRYRTEQEAFGRTAVCTGCSKSFRIGEALAQFEWKPTDIAEDSWIGVVPPEERKELRHCIMCDAPLGPDAVVCSACGANQVTGIVHRPKTEAVTQRRLTLPVLPLRMAVLLALLAAIGIGGYYAILAITRSATTVTDELVDQGTVGKGARYLRNGGDEYGFTDRFPGRVTDENLPRFVRMLAGADAMIRQSAALMIGAGQIANLTPLVDSPAQKTNPDDVNRALHAIGARRLFELTHHTDQKVREAAAKGICMISGIDPVAGMAELAKPLRPAARIEAFNALCRPWPEATGKFTLLIGDKPAPTGVFIEQVGRMFYMRVGSMEFHTIWSAQKELLPLARFAIPVARWCAATGAGMDVTSLEEIIGGTIALGSPSGAGWEGTVRAIGRQDFPGKLPGFLPLSTPGRGETVSAPVRLQR